MSDMGISGMARNGDTGEGEDAPVALVTVEASQRGSVVRLAERSLARLLRSEIETVCLRVGVTGEGVLSDGERAERVVGE